MNKHSNQYHFDSWAEFLTVTLSENVAHCQLGSNKVKKIRVTLSNNFNYPKAFKVILDNGLIASSHDNTANSDHSYDIDYLYQSPSPLPFGKNISDPVAKAYCIQAKKHDADFLNDNWSLSNSQSIPSILRQLALRNIGTMITSQLSHKGIGLTEDFSLQYFDGSNYLSFSYDALRQDLIKQLELYFKDSNVRHNAAITCFKHKHNRDWFNSLV